MDNQESRLQTAQEPERSDAPRQTKTPGKHRAGRVVLSLALVAAVAAGSSGLTYAAMSGQNATRNVGSQRVVSPIVASNVSYTSASDSVQTPRMVYENNAKCVVAISSVSQTTVYGQIRQSTSSGSGFLISENGYVVTNYHVIEGATSITVTVDNDEEYTAKVVGSDSMNDVALLKVDGSGLPYATLGSSDDLAIGDMVCAIGNPLGSLSATLTVGYVSGKDRQITTDNSIINMIQTDAAINSGNSGGPLFNMYGEVVGITSAKYSGSSSSGATIEGIGFAIPIDDVMGIIGDLQEYGYVTGAYLGVTVQNTDASAAKLYGMPTGAYVATVEPDGAAERAGIRVKDIIIAVDDNEVSNINELTRTLRRYKPGDTATITVIRSGERVKIDVLLDEKPRTGEPATADTEATMPQNGAYEEWYKFFFGEENNKNIK